MDTTHNTGPHANNPAKAKEHMAFLALTPDNQVTHKAIKNGSWFDPSVWDKAEVPRNGSHTLIPENIKLYYDQESDVRLKTVRLDGELTFVHNRNSKLVVDTFTTSPKSKLYFGAEDKPIEEDKTVRLIIADYGSIDQEWDPTLVSRGLITHGKVRICGAKKTSFVRMEDIRAGANELILKEVPRGWRVGDKLVVGGTSVDKNGNNSSNSFFRDELLTISNIKCNKIQFTNDDITEGDNTVLRFDHIRPDIPEACQLNLYVANTSRNVIFESESDAVPTQQRGHVMFMHNPDVVVEYAGFYNLGRTDKTRLVDDPGTNMDGTEGSGTNRRGRYSLHFHKNGADNIKGIPAIARGNAVVGSPGWGIVHHDSHAILEDNVVFDVAGAGIVAESGNEIGAWRNNLTVKTTGTGYYVLTSEISKRGNMYDHAFEGEGFWVQGAGQVVVEDNVAISANKSGITIFGDTLIAGDPRDAENVLVSNLPNHLQELFPEGTETVDITDVPLRRFDGFECYNSYAGISVWAHLTNFDGQGALDAHSPNATHNGRSCIENFKVWGCWNSGIRSNYSGTIDYKNGLIHGNTIYPTQTKGIFQNRPTHNMKYINLNIQGFIEAAIFAPQRDESLNIPSLSPVLENCVFSNNEYLLSKDGKEYQLDGKTVKSPRVFTATNCSFDV